MFELIENVISVQVDIDDRHSAKNFEIFLKHTLSSNVNILSLTDVHRVSLTGLFVLGKTRRHSKNISLIVL